MLRSLANGLKQAVFNKYNLISLLAGVLMTFAYAPFGFWWLAFVSLSVWVYQLAEQPLNQAVQRGYFFGLGWFGAGISWVHVSIDQFGGLPLAVSLALMLLLCAYLAIFPAMSTYIAARLGKNKQLPLILLPSAWVFSEWLRSWLLTGFPWLSIGYSQIDSPLAALAPIVGEVGISFIMMLIIVSGCALLRKRSVWASAFLSASLIIIIAVQYLSFTSPSGVNKKVALVQGNIAQELKWSPEQEWPSMLKYLDLTRTNYPADLIVWPESAVPAIEPLAGEFLDVVNSSAALNNTAIVTGIINYNFESKEYFNSLIVLGKKYGDDAQGSYYYPNSNRFYKHHLLPIGEFVPFQELLRPIAPLFNLPMSSFTRGNYVQPNLRANGMQIAPLICFEIAFPEQLQANFTEQTDIILTVSNDAWFGTSHGPHQHMEIARMRALEFGRPLVRSTNTGITAAVNAHGKLIAQLPQFEEGVLKTTIKLVEGRTPFSFTQRYPTFLLALLLMLFALWYQRKTT